MPVGVIWRRFIFERPFEPPISIPGFDVIASWHSLVSRNPAHRWLREFPATRR
jgi:hypothetical protein